MKKIFIACVLFCITIQVSAGVFENENIIPFETYQAQERNKEYKKSLQERTNQSKKIAEEAGFPGYDGVDFSNTNLYSNIRAQSYYYFDGAWYPTIIGYYDKRYYYEAMIEQYEDDIYDINIEINSIERKIKTLEERLRFIRNKNEYFYRTEELRLTDDIRLLTEEQQDLYTFRFNIVEEIEQLQKLHNPSYKIFKTYRADTSINTRNFGVIDPGYTKSFIRID